MTWAVRQPSSHGAVVVRQHPGFASAALLLAAMATGRSLLRKTLLFLLWVCYNMTLTVHESPSIFLCANDCVYIMYIYVHPVFRYMPPHPARAAVAVQVLKRSTVLSDTSPAFPKPFPKTQRGSTWGKTRTTRANRSAEAFLSMAAQRGEN